MMFMSPKPERRRKPHYQSHHDAEVARSHIARRANKPVRDFAIAEHDGGYVVVRPK
jgi:hypothetical protein